MGPRIRKAITLLLLHVAFGVPVCLAQWRGPQLIRLGPDEGLPAYIYSMAQDSAGYVYFASNVGLYQYDGQSVTFYGHDAMDSQSISSGAIHDIMVSRDGSIWLTTQFGGLNLFDPRTKTFHRYPLPALPFRNILATHALYEDEEGLLWVGTAHYRLISFDRKTAQFTTYSPPEIDAEHDPRRLTILSIVPDIKKDHMLWLSVLDYGLEQSAFDSYRLVGFDTRSKTFIPQPCTGRTKYQEPNGILWGTHWGAFVSRFDPYTAQCDTFHYRYTYEGKDRQSVSQDIQYYQGRLLIVTSKALLHLKPDNTYEVVCQPESADVEYTCLFVDRDENLWIGTNQGAFALNPDHQHIRFYSLEAFGEAGRIYPGRLAYVPSRDALYLSHTSNPAFKGLYKIQPAGHPLSHVEFIPTDFFIEGIACDRKDRVWVAGNGQFLLLDTVTNKWIPSHLKPDPSLKIEGIQNIRSNPDGWLGAISSGRFTWFHEDFQEVRQVSWRDLPGSPYAKSYDNAFDGFSFGRGEKVYLFSNEMHQLDLRTGHAMALKYDPVINPSTQRFLCAAEDPEGHLWISTTVHIGKYRLEKDSLILLQTYGIKEGMISPTAAELHIDPHGRVWAFTSSGLNGIDPVTGEIRFFGTKEGLPYPFLDPRQVITIKDGQLATVAGDGIIIFPSEPLWASAAPSDESVVIKDVRIHGQKVAQDMWFQPDEKLVLYSGNAGVDIVFQALAFPTDHRMEYSYRILGLQEEWISLGRNKLVTLPSLPPGHYTFQVKVGRPESPSPVTALTMFVPTPWYRTWWFVCVSLMGVMSAGYLLMRYRIQTIRAQEAERVAINKQMAELELKALRSQMNPHFMFNSLNSIKNYILQAEPKLAAEYLSNFAHLIRMILQHSREKSITLQEELETLILYIELEQIRFDHRFEFNCVVEHDVDLSRIQIPPMLLQPYVENAIWHGLMHKKDQGHLLLSFARHNGMVECMIEDDGIGRQASAAMKSQSTSRYKSMGMGITRDRIDLMNKMDALGISTTIEDKQDVHGQSTGTRVILRLPGPEVTEAL